MVIAGLEVGDAAQRGAAGPGPDLGGPEPVDGLAVADLAVLAVAPAPGRCRSRAGRR